MVVQGVATELMHTGPYITKRMVKVGGSEPRAGGTRELKKLDTEIRNEYQQEAVAATGLSLATVK